MRAPQERKRQDTFEIAILAAGEAISEEHLLIGHANSAARVKLEPELVALKDADLKLAALLAMVE